MDEHTSECVLVHMTVLHVHILCAMNMYMYTHTRIWGLSVFIDVGMCHSI